MTDNIRHLRWFTHTNIETRKLNNTSCENPFVEIDLTKYILKFINNNLNKRARYKVNFPQQFDQNDLKKIKSLKIDIHSKGAPYSNGHSYENVIAMYHDVNTIENWKLSASDLQYANKMAVVSVIYESDYDVSDELTREEERDLDTVVNKYLSENNILAHQELLIVKSIITDFLQFMLFSLHLTFPTVGYAFFNDEYVYQSGLIIIKSQNKVYVETSKTDILGHYILLDNLESLEKNLELYSNIWCIEIPSVNFFLNALKGSHMTIENFSKMVFTIESFYNKNISVDFIKLTISLLIGENTQDVIYIKKILTESFKIRNDYVHGGNIPSLNDSLSSKDLSNIWTIFFELKNIVIRIFNYYVAHNLYARRTKQYINDELIISRFIK